jgi:hypothetical protein
MRHISMPAPVASQSHGTAMDFINAINAEVVWMEHQKKSGEAICVLYGGAFGVFRAIRI